MAGPSVIWWESFEGNRSYKARNENLVLEQELHNISIMEAVPQKRKTGLTDIEEILSSISISRRTERSRKSYSVRIVCKVCTDVFDKRDEVCGNSSFLKKPQKK